MPQSEASALSLDRDDILVLNFQPVMNDRFNLTSDVCFVEGLKMD